MDLFNTLSNAFNPVSKLSNFELCKQIRFNEAQAFKFQEIAERTKSEVVKKQSLRS